MHHPTDLRHRFLFIGSAALVALATACDASILEPIADGTGGGGATGPGSGGSGGDPVGPGGGGSGGNGNAKRCEPRPIEQVETCPVLTPNARKSTLAEARQSIVGTWIKCNGGDGSGIFPIGVVFHPDGELQLLRNDNGFAVCGETIDDLGSYLVNDKSGIGLPDELLLEIDWEGGAYSAGDPIFANESQALRVVNGGGENEDMFRRD